MLKINYWDEQKINLNHPAVVWYEADHQKQYTFAELQTLILRRSDYFQKELLLQKGDVVAVLTPRSPEYLINMLALWQFGAIYLPLSAAWSEPGAILSRLQQSNATCLLTTIEMMTNFKNDLSAWSKKIFDLNTKLPEVRHQNSLNFEIEHNNNAYIYSSSGTTGQPKLIMLPHAGILDRIDDHIEVMKLNPQKDSILGFSDFGFDASMVEMLIALRSGNTLFVAPQYVRSEALQALPAFIAQHPQITTAILIPSLLRELSAEHCSSLTKIITTGEACPLKELREKKWLNSTRIYNGYGPTETTFGASLTPLAVDNHLASIHRPMRGIILYLRESFQVEIVSELPNSDYEKNIFYVSKITGEYFIIDSLENRTNGKLNEDWLQRLQINDEKNELRLLAYLSSLKKPRIIADSSQGSLKFRSEWQESFPVMGEILIESSGIGTYLNLPEKVAEKFIDEKSARVSGFNHKIFISGDICLFDGKNLVYKHRLDNQIKRYGQQITLDEVEQGLMRCASFIDNVVVIYTKEHKLFAFIQANESILNNDEERKKASRMLWQAIYSEQSKLEPKLRPNMYYWVKELPKHPQRDKILRNESAYQNLNPRPQLMTFTDKIHDETKTISTLAKIWQKLLDAESGFFESDSLKFDLDTPFSLLGGDSLLRSVMIQRVWEYHSQQDTPAPNDFHRGIIYNTTLNGIAKFLNYYKHHALTLLNGTDEGMPVFSFITLDADKTFGPIYHLSLPQENIDSDLELKSLLIVIKRQCQEKQPNGEGPYHFVSDEQHMEFALALASVFSALDVTVYLTVQSARTISHIDNRIHLSVVNNKNNILAEIKKIQPERTQQWVMYLLKENMKRFMSNNPAAKIINYGESFNVLIPKLQEFFMCPKIQSTFWVIGAAGSGKTTLIQQAVKESNLVLFLDVKRIMSVDFFEAMLNKQVPSWCWPVLRKERLTFIVDDYDAIARLDCPNLWAQASACGFSKINWVMTCRQDYWQTYYPVLAEYQQQRQWFIDQLEQTVPSFAPTANLLQIPNTPAAYQIFLTVTMQQHDKNNSQYLFLKNWFEREYKRHAPLAHPINFVQQAFDSMVNLYQHYLLSDRLVWLALQPSHWQLHQTLPSLQALSHYKAVLSLFSTVNKPIEIEIKVPYTLSEFKILAHAKLAPDMLRILRKPTTVHSDAKWYCYFLHPHFATVQKQRLTDSIVNQLITKIKLPLQYKIEEVRKIIATWQPLQFARAPDYSLQQVQQYLGDYRAETKEQQTHNNLQSRAESSFWAKISLFATDPKEHVLHFQSVPDSTPLFLFHPLTGDTPIEYRMITEALGTKYTLYALQMAANDQSRNIDDKAEMYYRYITTIQSRGPYVLLGWSFGAILAFRTAIMLEENGHEVDLVINFDSPPPQFIHALSPAERALSMVSILINRIYLIVGFNFEEFQKSLGNSYTMDDCFDFAIEQLQKLPYTDAVEKCQRALKRAKINSAIYTDFANWCVERKPVLKSKYLIYEANNKEPLNETDFLAWQEYAPNTSLVPVSGDHFTLFKEKELLQNLRQQLNSYQSKSLSPNECLAKYKQTRLATLAKVKTKQDSVYIPAMALPEQHIKNPVVLEKLVSDFLHEQNLSKAQCFLIQGDPGSGKSYFSQQLEKKCWQEEGFYFPLWIKLSPNKSDLLKNALLEMGFTETYIEQFKQILQSAASTEERLHRVKQMFGAPLLIIFDGYDEALTKNNLFQSENLQLWAAKALISCRGYAVNWQTMHQQFGDANFLLQTVSLQEFTNEEILNYLSQVSLTPLDPNIIDQLPDKNLIRNPLLLSIAVDFWDKLPQLKNRAAFYKIFFDNLYLRDQQKLLQAEGIRPTVAIKQAFEDFNQQLACQYWRYQQAQTKSLQLEKIEPHNHDTEQAKLGNRLTIDTEGRLTHITFWEYQFAYAIIYSVINQDFSNLATAYPIILGDASLCDNLSLLTMIAELASTLTPAQNNLLKHHLLLTVYASKHIFSDQIVDRAKTVAAANCISILNVMQVSFSGLDLRAIRVPGAYLSNGIFDTACLREADLQNCKMHGAILRFADLRGANLKNIDLGVRPILTPPNGQGGYQCICYGKNLLIAGWLEYIVLQQLETGKIIKVWEAHDHLISSIAINHSNNILFTGDETGEYKLWNLDDYSLVKTLQEGEDINLNSEYPQFEDYYDKIKAKFNSVNNTIIVANKFSESDLLRIKIWDLATFDELIALNISHARNHNYALSTDCKFLAIQENPKTVNLYSIDKHEVIVATFEIPPSDLYQNISALIFYGKNELAVGLSSNHIFLVQLENQKIEVKQIIDTSAPVNSFGSNAMINSEENSLLACFPGFIPESHGIIQVWNTKNYQEVLRVGYEGRASSADVFVFVRDQSILLANLRTGVSQWNLNATFLPVKQVADETKLVPLWHRYPPKTIISNNGQFRATIEGKYFVIFDQLNRIRLTHLQNKIKKKSYIVFHPFKALLISSSQEDGLKIWDLLSKNEAQQLTNENAHCLAINTDGNFLAYKIRENEIIIYDFNSKTVVNHVNINEESWFPNVEVISWSADRKHLALTTPSEIMIMDSQANSIIKRITVYGKVAEREETVYGVLNEDASLLAIITSSGSHDYQLKIVQIATNKLLSSQKLKNCELTCIRFFPNNILEIKHTNNQSTYCYFMPISAAHLNYLNRYNQGSLLNNDHLLVSKRNISANNFQVLTTHHTEANKKASEVFWKHSLENHLPHEISYQHPSNIDSLVNGEGNISILNIPTEIFFKEILKYLTWNEFKLLAKTNKYFNSLYYIGENITAQHMLIPHHYSTNWHFAQHGTGLRFMLKDAFDHKYDLVWPAWFLTTANLQPLHAYRLKQHNEVISEPLLIIENPVLRFTFRETSPSRLVYLLSTSYLFALALKIGRKYGLNELRGNTPQPLYKIYDSHKKLSMARFIRIIHFLATQNILIYDGSNQTISLTELGKAVFFAKINRQSTLGTIEYSHDLLNYTLSGPADALLKTIYKLVDLSHAIHDSVKKKIFDLIESGIDTEEQLQGKVRRLHTRPNPTQYNSYYSFNEYFVDDYGFKSHIIENDDELQEKLNQILTILCHYQFLHYNPVDKKYSNTALSKYLLKGHPEGLAATLWKIDEAWWRAVFAFEVEFNSLQPAFQLANQKSFFQYFADKKFNLEPITESMGFLSQQHYQNIAQQLKAMINQNRAVVDIAGGTGRLLVAIRSHYPNQSIAMTLYENEFVIENLKKMNAGLSIWKPVSGNLLNPSNHNKIPYNESLYLMKDVLHYFDNSNSLKILSHIRENIAKDGHLVVIDRIYPEQSESHCNAYYDLMMMLLGGEVRHRKQWLELFLLAGFNWINHEQSLLVEDHALMICKPGIIEVPRGIRFFGNKVRQIPETNEIKLLLTLCQNNHSLPDTYPLNVKAMSTSFDRGLTNYHPDLIYLLLHAIQDDPEAYFILPPLSYTNLKSYYYLDQPPQQYWLLPINLRENTELHPVDHWVMVVFIQYNNQAIYLDPAGDMMPNEIKEFLAERTRLKIEADQCFAIQKNRHSFSRQHSSIVMIALTIVMLQKISQHVLPNLSQKSEGWLTRLYRHVQPENLAEINILRQQQLRTLIEYLTELKEMMDQPWTTKKLD